MANLTITLFNYSTTTMKIIMRYTVDGQPAFKSSSPIFYTYSGQLIYPSNSRSIYVSILANNVREEYISIFTDAILQPDNICYRVSGTYPNLRCRHTPCPNFYNLYNQPYYNYFKYPF